jgi:hypothetical protein
MLDVLQDCAPQRLRLSDLVGVVSARELDLDYFALGAVVEGAVQPTPEPALALRAR